MSPVERFDYVVGLEAEVARFDAVRAERDRLREEVAYLQTQIMSRGVTGLGPGEGDAEWYGH